MVMVVARTRMVAVRMVVVRLVGGGGSGEDEGDEHGTRSQKKSRVHAGLGRRGWGFRVRGMGVRARGGG